MHDFSRRVLKFAMLAGVASGLWQAGAHARAVTGFDGLKPKMAAAVARAPGWAYALTPEPRVVWVGDDVDGDGQADFVNPTGQAPREHDGYGSGEFGASRDGGGRQHAGVDYLAEGGQDVRAPISGYVSKIGYVYGDDRTLRFIEITNPALRYVARVMYVDSAVVEGQAVRLGQTIGSAHSLQSKYPGITDHVHLEVARIGGRKLDATNLITAHVQTPAEALASASA